MPVRGLPHGVYSLIPAVLTSMGWIAALFQDGCDYAKLTGSAAAVLASNPGAPYVEVGFAAYREPTYNFRTNTWHTVYIGSCLTYPDSVEQDTYWKAAKAFAFLALVLGGGGTFFLWFSTCCVFSKGTWRWAGYEVGAAAIFQALAFLWFQTSLCQPKADDEYADEEGPTACSLFWGSKSDVMAVVLWTVSAGLIFGHYPKPPPPQQNDASSVASGDGIMRTTSTTSRPAVEVSAGELALSEPTVTTAAVAAGLEPAVVYSYGDKAEDDEEEDEGDGDQEGESSAGRGRPRHEPTTTMASGEGSSEQQQQQQRRQQHPMDDVEIV